MMIEKKTLRKKYLEIRKSIPEVKRGQLTLKTGQRLREAVFFKKAARILAYYPVSRELNLLPLFKKLISEKEFYFPKVIDAEKMVFYKVDNFANGFAAGYKRIPEPAAGKIFAGGEALVLVPGLCFNRFLFRLGYGGGFYDRFLTAHPGLVKAGCFYERQFCPEFIPEAHDHPLDYVVTEQKIYTQPSM